MQIAVVVIAIILGLTYNYYFDGFLFSPVVCLFAGLLMVMPTLFGFRLSDAKLISSHKTVMIKNLAVNFIILPILALAVGFLSGDFGLAAGLFLLGTLAGGGMVMHWIKKSQGDTKIGFILLFVNLALLTVSFFYFKLFGVHMAPYFDVPSFSSPSDLSFSGAIMPLVIIPFIASRLLLKYAPKVPAWMQRHAKPLSTASIFLIIFYLFGLANTHVLFEIDAATLLKAFVFTVLFYLGTFIVGKMVYNRSNPQESAAFWHTLTRYITLALVVSTFAVGTYGATLILPVMMAYFIQLPLAIYLNK